MKSPSPLRYPGGKARLYPLVSQLIRENSLVGCTYCEPFAGGAGLAFSLLVNGIVGSVKLNDLDVGIASFWRSVFHRPNELIELISSTPISINEWHRQQDVRKSPAGRSDLENGFALFFLNRTNRSGIVDGAGPIGGYEQTGQWLMDARFNRDRLSEQIHHLSQFKACVEISEKDADTFIDEVLCAESTFLYLDPPYYRKAQKLYLNHYHHEDHERIAEKLKAHRLGRWIVSYDDQPEIPGASHDPD
jgi:DNA adenine methylase